MVVVVVVMVVVVVLMVVVVVVVVVVVLLLLIVIPSLDWPPPTFVDTSTTRTMLQEQLSCHDRPHTYGPTYRPPPPPPWSVWNQSANRS